jgi:hypothetical protein
VNFTQIKAEIYENFAIFQAMQRGPSIGSGPQFYTKPPTALPVNQTIEFDEGPKITVFIGELYEFIQFTGS